MKETLNTLPEQSTDSEEEPPGSNSSLRQGQDEDEPPSIFATNRHGLFSHIPDNLWRNWKWQFQNRINSVEKLTKFIKLSPAEQASIELVARRYPLAVTPYYLSLMDTANPDDPIRKQAIPSVLEIAMGDQGADDPLNEEGNSVLPGLVHRYPDRVLMVLTDICPMLCRHCTRKREWHNGGWVRTSKEVAAMLNYIRQTKTVRDVIISGGDPLTLSNRWLEEILSSLRSIKHVEIIRIGSRFPVVLPQRIDEELCAILSQNGPIWFNTHFNHIREITPEAALACDRLVRSGVPVNNQSVLLRGINDSVKAQTELCHGLLKIKVRPYYLFHCDEVQGTEHLRTPIETGIKIIDGMRGYTSGLGVPTYVVDLPSGGGKISLQPDYMLSHTADKVILRNYRGEMFHYRNPDNISPALQTEQKETLVSSEITNGDNATKQPKTTRSYSCA